MPIKLIVGLRNPGTSYEQTRHNAGAWFTQSVLEHYSLKLSCNRKLQAELVELELPLTQQTCFIASPTTFMNQSGTSVRAIAHFFRIKPDEILVVHDELDLMPGRIKLKTGGGHGGHNGLRDIITQLGENTFHRLRIGIGHPGEKSLVLNYVLGKPTANDRTVISDAIHRAVEAIPTMLTCDLTIAMNELNSQE